MKPYLKALTGSALAALLAGATASAQAPAGAPPVGTPAPRPAPIDASPADRAKAMAHVAAAKKAAGYDAYEMFDHTCQRMLVGAALPFGRIYPPATRDPAQVFHEPVKVFDNVYYVGEKMLSGGAPSAWAIKTSEGIILIDALFEDSVQSVLIPGLRKLGLDPADIKIVILTHGHADHVQGAKFLQDTYKPKVILGGPDWAVLEAPNFRGAKPTRDVSGVDGQKVTLGDTTITLYATPGHTPGTMSMLIPVKDNGAPHMAALWGGTGMQFSPGEYSKSAERFREITQKAGADVMMSTHPHLDKSDIKLPLVLKRRPGEPNPWVVGPQVVQDYLTVARECGAATALLPVEYAGYLGRPTAAPAAAAPAGR